MELHEFYAKFANTPIGNRMIALDMQGYTLQNIYQSLHDIDEIMLPNKLRQQELLKRAEEGFKALEAARNK